MESTESISVKPIERTPVNPAGGTPTDDQIGGSPAKVVGNSSAKPTEGTSPQRTEDPPTKPTDSVIDVSLNPTKQVEDIPKNLTGSNTVIESRDATINDATTNDVTSKMTDSTEDNIISPQESSKSVASNATKLVHDILTKPIEEVPANTTESNTSVVPKDVLPEDVTTKTTDPTENILDNQQNSGKVISITATGFTNNISTNFTKSNTRVAPQDSTNVITDSAGDVVELKRQLAAMEADRDAAKKRATDMEVQKDAAIQRAAKRYQQMRLAESDSRNLLKAGKLEVTARLELQAKYNKLMFLLDCRDNSITELQNQLAHTQEHMQTLQTSSTNQQKLEAKHQESLVAARKDTENEVTARFGPQIKDLQTKAAASENQNKENQQKIASLENQLRITRAVNEQYKSKIQQQVTQQLQQQQAKRKFDGETSQRGASGANRAMLGWRSPAAPADVLSTSAFDAPDKRQRVSTPGNSGIPRTLSEAGSRTPETPSRRQPQSQLSAQPSPSQRILSLEEFGNAVNAQLRSLGQSAVSPLEVARKYNSYMAYSGTKGTTQSSPSRQSTLPSARQDTPSGLTGSQMQRQIQMGLKRRSSSIEAPNTLPAAKRLKPNPIPPLAQGSMNRAPSTGQAARSCTQSSAQSYQQKLPSIDEQKMLQSFSSFNKCQSSVPPRSGSNHELLQAAQNYSKLRQQEQLKAPSGNEMFGLHSNPAPNPRAQSFSSLPHDDFDDLYSMDFTTPPKQANTLESTESKSLRSIESTNPPLNSSQAPDFFDLGNLDLTYDINNPDSFGIASIESAPSVPTAAPSNPPEYMTGRITRSRSRSAAPQQIPPNMKTQPINLSYMLSSNAAAPQHQPTRQRSSTAERSTRARSTAPSGPLIPVCLSCHTNWWNSSCDPGASCQNCILSNTRCERIRCLNYDAGTCSDAKCRRVHEGHGYVSVVERPKTLRRGGRKGDSVGSPVERLGAGGGG